MTKYDKLITSLHSHIAMFHPLQYYAIQAAQANVGNPTRNPQKFDRIKNRTIRFALLDLLAREYELLDHENAVSEPLRLRNAITAAITDLTNKRDPIEVAKDLKDVLR